MEADDLIIVDRGVDRGRSLCRQLGSAYTLQLPDDAELVFGTEFGGKKCQQAVLRNLGPNHLRADRDYVDVVVLNALVS
jgi:hypothetical protein